MPIHSSTCLADSPTSTCAAVPQACYSLSEVGAQQFDAYGKIFTVKLQYIFYRERMGVRPGQISKVMQGQITSMGQFAKLGLPLEHAPQVSQLLKLGTQCSEDLKTFVQVSFPARFPLRAPPPFPLPFNFCDNISRQHSKLMGEGRGGGVYLVWSSGGLVKI